jgi:hypothetical protein
MSIEIGRIRVVTAGWIGGPGLSQLYFTGATAGTVTAGDCANAAAAVRAFYMNLSGYYHTSWTAIVDPIIQVIEATTGALIREQAITPPATVTGTGVTGYGPTSTGPLASWHTSSVFGRHLLRGRTFLGPMQPGAYNTSGRINGVYVTGIQAAGAALAALATASMVVWHRPHPLSTSANGGYGQMTGCSVSDSPATLRSRRD